MAYVYEQEKTRLFSEENQKLFLEIRDKSKQMLDAQGAFRYIELVKGFTGDSWLIMACVDRLVELKDIVPLRDPKTCWSQYQVYSTAQVHNF